MEFSHVSVLLSEVLHALSPERGGVFVDCTAGGGGHSEEIARRLPEGSRLICLDQDDDALSACRSRLAVFGNRVELVKSNFRNLDAALDLCGADRIDGALWDLGVSSHQLDDGERGFSYAKDAPLDMRMDRTASLTARDVVNTYSEDELRRIIRDWGEERFAGRIAARICEKREEAPIETTGELAAVIAEAIPQAARQKEAQNPARRTFQAIRIEVNGELDAIEPSIRAAAARMNPGGVLAAITFHSLEDRIVKDVFRSLSTGCTCPPEFPVCICGGKPVVKLLTKKPLTPGDEELASNPRSRSAKLRVAEKL
ncbi:MAG: 16S rRNA (cytosine(1402)-N(4))-methyltransferase RsmH [Ruminococcaceae bacterium]|jgi:16S rRNA (cytosine1402-N4)-methyltransferase|nr:16S rRNA (cytosine(1402)-N(4))-methyltransferase RsmH [Oscillospiraceae bacterium]